MSEHVRRSRSEQQQIRELLKQIHLFQGLEEDDLDRIAARLVDKKFRTGERIFQEGDYPDGWYIIKSGKVRIVRETREGEQVVVAMLVEGDYFGEVALIKGQARTGSAFALAPTVLLELDNEGFRWLIDEFPEIGKELLTIVKGYQIARKRPFHWLGEDESIHLVAQKHVLLLVYSLVSPLFLAFISLIVLALFFQNGLLRFIGGSGLLAAVAWGWWNWVDWANDYYIVTDKRVVWLEKVIFLYDSRREASLDTILSVNVATSQVQRIFGYGDVIVRTYTGSITMRNMGRPEQFRAAIEQYWRRVRVSTQQAQAAEMERIVRERLGLEEKKKPRPQPAPDTEDVPTVSRARPRQAFFLSRLFSDLLKVRYEREGVITYRKHWYLLFRRIWPLLVVLGINFVLILLRIFGAIEFISLSSLVSVFFWIIVFSLPFWVYQYLDWRDDLYQVTDRDLIDYDRKPLGREERITAPLENILSIEHERKGIISLLLNFGTVIINVGDRQFDFEGVANPAEVQHDLFERYYARRKQIEQEEAERERERVLEWIDVYHRNIKDFLATDDTGESEIEAE